MAYVDLVQAQPVAVAGGAQYNWAYDTPIAADGSPNITNMGLHIDFGTAAALAAAPADGLADIITSLRVKVGSTIIMNWNNNATKVGGGTAMSQLGVLIQRLGGNNFCKQNNRDPAIAGQTFGAIAECSWPVGLDASRSHRVNIQVTLGNEVLLLGGAPLLPASTAINTIHYYGTSTEATIVGSRQDFTMSASSTRTVTVYGKSGWSMLGLMICDNIAGPAAGSMVFDVLTEARVNNGAFREVSPDQWRAYNNAWGNPDRTSLTLGGKPDNGVGGLLTSSVGGNMGGQAATLFMNLRRLTAGSNIDIAFTYGVVGSTLALYPIWVAPVGRQTANPPKQTTTPVVSQTATVESGTQS